MAHAFEWGKLSKCHFKGKTNRKWVNGLKIYDSEKFWTLGAGLPPPRGNIHVYDQNIQRPFFSKTAWPMKAKRQIEHPYSLYKWSRSYNQDGRHGYN